MIKVSESISVRKIDEEIFIFDRKTSTIHSLNQVGTFIWELLCENTNLQEITDKICTHYDIDRETAEKDKLEYIKELEEKKLLQIIAD